MCLGSVERPLGIAARLAGDLDAAVDHFERAIDANLNLANRPVTAMCRAEAALALVERGRSEDRDRAQALLAEAIADAEVMAMDAWVLRWRHRAAAIDTRPGVDTGFDAQQRLAAVFRRVGGHWEVGAAGRPVVVTDMVGMGYLARLVAQPGVEIPAVTLASGGVQVPSTGRQEVLDDQAAARLRRSAPASWPTSCSGPGPTGTWRGSSGWSWRSTRWPVSWSGQRDSRVGDARSPAPTSGPAPPCARRSSGRSTRSPPPVSRWRTTCGHRSGRGRRAATSPTTRSAGRWPEVVAGG